MPCLTAGNITLVHSSRGKAFLPERVPPIAVNKVMSPRSKARYGSRQGSEILRGSGGVFVFYCLHEGFETGHQPASEDGCCQQGFDTEH